ncbi:MAG: putative stomatin/prohibitin-family rane protease [Labilithrix sp.]|nr:putative stomatin/prohibitin-family rane protease [Labilithrix sp.]
MNPETLRLVAGLALGLALIPVLALAVRATTISVEDEEAVLITSFGKLVATLTKPGLHVLPSKLMPWLKHTRVSLRRDFRHFKNVHVNDARGTTVIVDLWVEFRVADPAKAMFSVTDWDHALQNLVSHAATSILGSREFREILCDRTELGELLEKDIAAETAAWGIAIELVFIRNVSLLPEVSRQMFETIAARLERAKADVEENGRLDVAQLEADTAMRVAALVAEAKGQYPAAVGRALGDLKGRSKLFAAYNELYELSLVRPHRTVAFRGFADGEIRAADAAMVPLETGGGSASLPARVDGVMKRS